MYIADSENVASIYMVVCWQYHGDNRNWNVL